MSPWYLFLEKNNSSGARREQQGHQMLSLQLQLMQCLPFPQVHAMRAPFCADHRTLPGALQQAQVNTTYCSV